MHHAIGFDFGTSGLKAVLVDADGRIAARASRPYATRYPHAGWSEQDPDTWWQALIEAACELAEAGPRPDVIGLSGQMHAPVVLGGDEAVLAPAILWNDQRSISECDEIERLTDGRIAEWTGNPPRTAFTASKILWMRRHQPDLFDRIDKVLLPKDFIRFRLTGVIGTDPSDASGTNLFDVRNGRWSAETLEALGVPAGWMPPVVGSATTAGRIDDASAAQTGLPAGIPVIMGASDQAAAAIGCGVVEPGSLAIVLGTSAVVSAASKGPAIDPSGAFHSFCHAMPDTWQMMGGVLSAGGAVQWFRDRIAAEPGAGIDGSADGYADILGGAREISPGAEGLVFLPYLTGERAPHNDPQARGAWFGLTARHDRRHLARAVFEGVSFALRQLVEQAEALGMPAGDVRIAGGGSRGGLWPEILSSVLGRPIAPVETPDASAFGAAILAMAGLSAARPENLAAGWVRAEETVSPVREDLERYDKMYRVFSQLYPATRDAMHRLSDIDRS